MDERLVLRTRDTPPQVQAARREQRRSNVEEGFRCGDGLSGGSVILVDDVATTGNTLSACAAALKDAEPGSLWGLTVAREA